MPIDFAAVILLAAIAFAPAMTVLIVTVWCNMEKDGKKKKRLPCLSTEPKPDTRTKCPKCGKLAHRPRIRTYTQPGVAVWRYYKCDCGQPFRQGDYLNK